MDLLTASLAFLHISDIHFHPPKGVVDINEYMLKELLKALKALKPQVGKVDAVLVSGDIAFSAEAKQYEKATKWLDEICEAAGCDKSNVVVIPGNHDIHRKTADQIHIKALHGSVRTAGDLIKTEKTMDEIYKNGEAIKLIYSSLEPYNKFAAQYSCSLQPSEPTVKKFVGSVDGIKMGLWGMNSCLVSDSEDEQGNLFVDERQLQVPAEDDTYFISLCHHPPSWLKHSANVEEWLNAKAPIQLFGHVHQQSTYVSEGRVIKIFSGAVQPERDGNDWRPAFNLFTVAKVRKGKSVSLKVRRYGRMWDHQKKAFGPEDGQAVTSPHEVILEVSRETPKKKGESASKLKRKIKIPKVRSGAKMDTREFLSNLQTAGQGSTVSRRTNRLFMRLPQVEKKAICAQFKILTEEQLKNAEWPEYVKALSGTFTEEIKSDLEESVESHAARHGIS